MTLVGADVSGAPTASATVSVLEAIEVNSVISVAWLAAVAAPVGSGKEDADTGIVLWSEAITTASEAAEAFWPSDAGSCPEICV